MNKIIIILSVAAIVGVSSPNLALCDLTCAQVSIELLQKLTLERVAFDANLKLTNGLDNVSLDNVTVNLTITDSTGADPARNCG